MIVCYQISHSDTLQPVQDKATWTVPGQTVSESITGEGSLTFTLEMYPDIGFSNRISAFPYVIDIGDEIFMMVRTLGTIVTFLGQISDGRRHPFVNLVSTLCHSCVILASP